MYTRKLPPKLGSLQRWVRDCDATVSADGSVRDADAMKCLDLILRIANPASIAGPSKGNELIRRKPIWEARGPVEGEINVWERMQNGTLFGKLNIPFIGGIKLICQIPNQLYLTQTSELSNIPQATSVNHQTSTTRRYTVHPPVLSVSPHLRDLGLRLVSTFLDYQERSWSWTYSRPRNVYKSPKLLKLSDSRKMKLLEDLLLPKHRYVIVNHLGHGS